MRPRLWLCLFVQVLTSASVAGFTASTSEQGEAPEFKVTVWLVRPVAKHIPTPKEQKTTWAAWSTLKLGGEGQPFPNDATLLSHLRRDNPRYVFDQLRFKQSSHIAADSVWTASLPNRARYSATIHVQDRKVLESRMIARLNAAAASFWRHETASSVLLEQKAQFGRDETAIYGTSRVTMSPARNPAFPWTSTAAPSEEIRKVGGGGRQGESTAGVGLVRLGQTFLVNNGVGYSTVYSVKNPKSGKTGPVVRQVPTDILLVRIDRAR